tara:strand:- start:3843 stop:3956 length:114 start_codon:yes stop_codon:yes gene_type:complete
MAFDLSKQRKLKKQFQKLDKNQQAKMQKAVFGRKKTL